VAGGPYCPPQVGHPDRPANAKMSCGVSIAKTNVSTTPKVAQLAQLTPSPPIIEYYSHLHHCNRLLKLYIMVLILAGFMMATATNPDLFPTAFDPASHDRFESFKDEIQELIQQQNYTNKEVVAALARRGFITSLRSLERRLKTWGIRRLQTSQITDELAQAVNHLFHHTLLNDE
jgi:Clr5 domain